MHFPRTCPLPCLKLAHHSNHYLARTYHLICSGSFQHILGDLSFQRVSQRLRMCCEAISNKFAAHDTRVPLRFQTYLCSCRHGREEINYKFTRFGKLVSKVHYESNALRFQTNQTTFFLSLLPGHWDEYLLEPSELRSSIQFICLPWMPWGGFSAPLEADVK